MLVRENFAQADGLIVGSPVYFAGPNGSLCALLDRLFRLLHGPAGLYKPQLRLWCVPPRGRQCRIRPTEQIFHDLEHAGRLVAVLEQCPRASARWRRRRIWRVADHAGPRTEHGPGAEGRADGVGKRPEPEPRIVTVSLR